MFVVCHRVSLALLGLMDVLGHTLNSAHAS
jgi:hypothetical protein